MNILSFSTRISYEMVSLNQIQNEEQTREQLLTPNTHKCKIVMNTKQRVALESIKNETKTSF